MNILFLTSRIPFPPNRGDKLRTYNFIKILSQKHKIILVCLYEKKEELEYKSGLIDFVDEIHMIKVNKYFSYIKVISGLLFSKLPSQICYYHYKKVKNEISKILEIKKIDVIYSHLIRMAEYVKNYKSFSKILDYTDAISIEYLRSLPYRNSVLSKLFFKLESIKTLKYEKKICERFDKCWFIGKEDPQKIWTEIPSNIEIMPNPVKKTKFKTNYETTNSLVFLGNLSVPHNIFAVKYLVEKIMPEILKDFPKCALKIIGANPKFEITNFNGKNSTKILGFIDDLSQELINSDIFIAPLFFSAGMQNKILEAMEVGVPIITTSNVSKPIIGDSEDILEIANNFKEFLASTRKILKNKKLRETLGRNSRKYIDANFSEDKISELLFDKINCQ